ncbi:retrovirus-related pol polyprotein from transposon TNT 1-94 [Tanacetum coccineum]|uniref:Retrovirus-related pol polyprotein from transposon TNT 1-94 n=1 Tax=Tanacetum coccineum TaxID=301880 RepID=A0ABQ4X5N6_9ASTR
MKRTRFSENKSHLVCRRYRQEEVNRFLKKPSLLFARMECYQEYFWHYAAHKAFTVFQMDVKTQRFPLHAPRAWYDVLSKFLLQNPFSKGTIDPTLFIRSFDDDILVVQVYVDDIIFGSTNPRYTQLFADLMKSRFEMPMMGEMSFFLSLQVNQSPRGIFINQSNYVLEILKKYGMDKSDPVGTPMEIKDKLDLDQNRTLVDEIKYSNIGALMYLTSSRPNIVHATCLCARYQAKPTEKHLKEVKRIFLISREPLIRVFENIVVNLDSSSDNNNSDLYNTSQISTSEEIDYNSPEPPKSVAQSTDNESTNMETADKGNTDRDCIDDSNSAMSKGCVPGLASVTTWDEIEKKMGARKLKTCADKAKGKRKVSCGS